MPRGRPRTQPERGPIEKVSVRMRPKTREEIEAWQERTGLTFDAALRLAASIGPVQPRPLPGCSPELCQVEGMVCGWFVDGGCACPNPPKRCL